MPRLQRRSFTTPDQVRSFSHSRIDVVNLDETTMRRFRRSLEVPAECTLPFERPTFIRPGALAPTSSLAPAALPYAASGLPVHRPCGQDHAVG